eukprot:Skav205037  [mRNA]  locus=scaffold2506:40665:42299:+ [translate_table: standard]
MSKESLYDALLVDQNATLDEIKLAFKRRALQVHPDKGGSKEAFHLVYQALETLADPEARKKYDSGLAMGTSESVAKQSRYRPQKNAATQGQSTAYTQMHSKTEKSSSSRRKQREVPEVPQSPQSKQTKMLKRIRDLLKQLPREMRNDAISKHFSQRQRLILEKWMADQSAQGAPIKTLKLGGPLEEENCKTAKNTKRRPVREGQSSGGYVKKKGILAYEVGICFDAIQMQTRLCDFQTGLEYLVVLTAVKQKMRDPTSTEVSFEERLQSALASSAIEHGKDLADMRLCFTVVQAAGFFMGTDLRTPGVRSIEKFGSIRRCLEPFRQYAKNQGASNIYWQYSPAHLQNALKRFRSAVADAWEIAGVAQVFCTRSLRVTKPSLGCERRVYCNGGTWQDKNKYRRPFRKRKPALEQKQRQQTAREERNKRRLSKLKVKLGLQKLTEDPSYRKSMVLKRLLVRWEKMLQREALMIEKERRRLLRKRMAQRKKDQDVRRRLELLHRKRLREKEKQRREALCKRMRSDLTMDEILGDRAGHEGGENGHEQ